MFLALVPVGCVDEETLPGVQQGGSTAVEETTVDPTTGVPSTTGVDPEEGTTTGGPDETTESGESSGSGSTTGDASTSSSSGGDESSSTGDESTGGVDIDTVCEWPDEEVACEMPSPFQGQGECDPFAQDCAEGERCVPWADDGGTSWNATRCSPLSADPDQVGESCMVEGSGVSGIDTCDVGLMCWAVDAETNTGTCIELCGCGPEQPTCGGGGACSIANDGVLPLCLPACDPLDAEGTCPTGEACYPVGDGFQCAPDASGSDGQPGSPCSFINACDPGAACVDDAVVPNCFGAGCCAAFCDLDVPGTCPVGTTCEPWFNPGEEPLECHVDTGVCIVP